ncbi:hypothetical protein X975_19323, partial [Stegodyphus mimosarum]
MNKNLVLLVVISCCLATVLAKEYLEHDYDIQIHPTHGHSHHGYGDHGFATSVRYDRRYHHKIPEVIHSNDVIYQYVSDGGYHDEEG